MLGDLYCWGQFISQVNVVQFSAPSRARIRVDQLGGPPTFVPGRVIPGHIEFEVGTSVSFPDHDLTLEYQGKKYKLEVTTVSSAMGRTKQVEGYIY